MKTSRSDGPGLLYLSTAAFLYGWPNIIIRVLKGHFDPLTQSFYRYVAAAGALLLFAALARPHKLRGSVRALRSLAVPVLIVSLHQLSFMVGAYETSAITASLLAKVGVLFTAVLSYVVLEEERSVLRSPMFQLGTLLALTGVAGFILGGGQSVRGAYGVGTLICLFSAFCWSLYVVRVKRLVATIDALAISAWVPALACLVFLMLYLVPRSWAATLPGSLRLFVGGDITSIAHVPWTLTLLLLASGILVIGIGNSLNYHAIEIVGPSVSASFMLVTPLITGGLAYLILGERLTPMQILSGGVLLLGCYCITRVSGLLALSVRSTPSPREAADDTRLEVTAPVRERDRPGDRGAFEKEADRPNLPLTKGQAIENRP